jgi:preprotein translocase subunit SecG
MIYGLLVTLFVVICLFMIFIILMQKGKGSSGIGNLGGGAQQLFGGSGGADFLQKMTWVAGLLFMFISLTLSLLKMRSLEVSKYATSSSSSQQVATIPTEEVVVESPVHTSGE